MSGAEAASSAVVPGDLTFTPTPEAKHFTVSDGSCTVTVDRWLSSSWAVCGLMMTEGRHRWSVAATTNSLAVGIAQGLSIYYLLFGSSGETYSTSGGKTPYCPPLQPNDVVQVELDLWEGGGGGTIAFAVNDGPCEIAMSIFHPGPFRPVVWLSSAHGPSSCSILSYQRDPDD